MQNVEQEVRESNAMEDKLVMLLEETCQRVEKTVIQNEWMKSTKY